MGSASDPVRVLAVYGSESGTAKAAIKKLATALGQDSAVQIVDIKEGNSVGALETLTEKYDLVLVATSSFGEGDPPDNYAGFLAKLLKGSKGAEYPLTGMMHAVLGLGSSCYDTFQNVPRLSDKMLGECGSRRIAQRCELDDSGPGDDTSKDQVKAFEAAGAARSKKEELPMCPGSGPGPGSPGSGSGSGSEPGPGSGLGAGSGSGSG